MSKEDEVEVEGVVVKALSNSRFSVQTENGQEVLAYPAGKIRKYFIRIVPGDRVTLALSLYDLTKGRITYRHKK